MAEKGRLPFERKKERAEILVAQDWTFHQIESIWMEKILLTVNVDICTALNLFSTFAQTWNHCPYIRCMHSEINNHNVLFTEKGWIYARTLLALFVRSFVPIRSFVCPTGYGQGKTKENRFTCIYINFLPFSLIDGFLCPFPRSPRTQWLTVVLFSLTLFVFLHIITYL